MKNNKGFTLVELLAVIALIGLLSVVGVATYRGVNESSKKKALEAKITQLKSAAEKWGRENNITNKTNISVNALVVEGYITADEVSPDGLAMIRNPVTSENMICNTIDLSFKNGVITSTYHSDIQDCKLANQSLVDNKINITVIAEGNVPLSGTSSIAKWTNKDIIIVVNSTEYDPKATSISFDFEGNTVTKSKDVLGKYTGNTFLTETEAASYYNVFYIKSELILNTKVIVTYEIPGEGTKSRAYTIRFDKEEATATLKANSEWITSETPVTILLDDGKGSGPKNFYLSTQETWDETKVKSYTTDYKGTTTDPLEVGKYYVWTEDQAGNISHTYKMIMEVNNVDDSPATCHVVFEGTLGDHGWYKENPVTPYSENTDPAGVSGVNLGVNLTQGTPTYTGFAAYNTIGRGKGEIREAETPKGGTPYYCYARTLAGNTAGGNLTLYLDRTPPTSIITVTGPETHTKTKRLNVTIQDALSGLNATSIIKYGYSQSPTVPPQVWYTLSINATEQTNSAITKSIDIGGELTGTWYVWINVDDFKDYAGNISKFTSPPGDNEHYNRYGPYKFDNTPPVCNGNNGKTDWSNGSYNLLQYCRDNDGTDDQSGCAQNPFVKVYTTTDNVRSSNMTISDFAGNTTVCPHDVYLEHIKPTCWFTEPGPNGDNGWYKSASVTLTEHHQDNGAEELQSKVVLYGAATTANPKNYSTTVTFTKNGASLTAHCYVEDDAGNFNTNSKTVKKDDGSEAQAGGCTPFGNSHWTNSGPVTYGYRLNTHPVSGCHEGYDESGGIWTSDCREYNVYRSSLKTLTLPGLTAFITNSGVTVLCNNGTHDIYLDLKPPTCNVVGTGNNGSESGVKVKVTCTDQDNLSGCATSGDDQGSHSGVKSTTTYTVKDRAKNTKSCTITITSKACDCDNCKTGSPNKCVGGYVTKTQNYTSSNACRRSCSGSCEEASGNAVNKNVVCTYRVWDDCKSTKNTCEPGCDTCYYYS